MRAQRVPLRAVEATDVDPVRDRRPRRPGDIELIRIESAGREPEAGREVHRTGDRLTGQRRLEQSRGTGGEHRCRTHGPVHLQVIRVAVAAAGVVADEHVRILLVEDRRDPPRHGESILACEPADGGPIEPGVGVSEGDGARDAEDGGRLVELGPSHGRQPLLRELGRGEPRRAVRGHDEDDTMTLGGRPRHRPGGEESLVVGVGMDEHEGPEAGSGGEHGHILAQPAERYRPDVRIVHVSDCFAPRAGGIETQVQALAIRQAARGHEVHVVTATPAPADTAALEDGRVSVHRITMPMPFDLPIHLRTRDRVATLLRGIRPDVVHVHVGAVSPFAWGAVRAAHQVGVPVLATAHSMWGPLARTSYGLSNALLRWTRWGVTPSAVSSVAAADVARALHEPFERVLVLPNGIDAEAWRRGSAPAAGGTLELVTVMRLAPRKRLLPLLRIIERSQPNADVRLTIVGDGPDRARGERAARDLPVSFAGRLDADGIRAVFARSHAFIQPSVRESFGIAALEARSAGLPVIARSQTGTAGFIVDGVNGLLGAHDAELVHAVVRLANDPSLLARMTAWNTSHAPEQDWPSVLDAVELGYRRAIDVGVSPR